MNRIQKAASLLGSRNRGKKKIVSKEESMKRSLRLAEARKTRWPKKDESS